MSNSPNKKMYPRPLKFNSTMQDFVFGSSWQLEQKRRASPPQKIFI